MFCVNDTILYGAQGVCRIASIVRESFGSGPVDYYVLKPVYNDNSTIYVPVENGDLTGKMRRILSSEEIIALIRSMPQEDLIWIENENQRKEAYREIIARGDRTELVKMIKTLYLHQQQRQAIGKKLHIADERFFKEAEKMLYDEFALVLNIKQEEVLPFILEQIELNEKENGV